MPLFQKNVLKDYLKNQDQQAVDKAYENFSAYFHDAGIQKNIRHSNEEQFQATFLTKLFVDALGYTLFPDRDHNLTTEHRNEVGAKKADGAILAPTTGGQKAIAVIELKSTKTKDLESIRKQAFDYKANHTECRYVITSNFEKLRFYVNDAVEWLEFDLFRATKDDFAVLHLCLQKDNLLNDLPQKIKSDSLLQEEKVTKNLYKDYSLFRMELFRDLVNRNRRNPELKEHSEKSVKFTLFKKTQKLLDRFLFIFFAEDRGLIPRNMIKQVNNEWKDLQKMRGTQTLYDRYKLYFSDLNNGNRDQDIFAYNGGLFEPDPILDHAEVDDELLFKHTEKLTNYDFESEVDVNILGHIFEHSLNEIESVNAEIEGVDFDKQKARRKKDGVFYTPKYITKYIVDNTIGKLCDEKKEELEITAEVYEGAAKRNRKRIDNLQQYRDWLLGLKICDPACGSGAFLNQALEFLIAEHRHLDELSAAYHKESLVLSEVENSILENNLYGVDINQESVDIAKLSLWLRTAQRGRKLTSLSNNIKCGNSLIDSKAVAGDKAFRWDKEFPEVFEKGGFDVVIGNPPYVRIQNLNSDEVDFYFNQFKVPTGKLDISTLFFEKALQISNDGVCSFISSSQWMQTDYGKNLRGILANGIIREVIDFGSLPVFADADTYPAIFLFSTKKVSSVVFKKVVPTQGLNYEAILNAIPKTIEHSKLSNKPWNTAEFNLRESLGIKKIDFLELKHIAPAFIGDLTGMDKAFVVHSSELGSIEKDILLPYAYRGEEVQRYIDVSPQSYVIYPYISDDEQKPKLIDESTFKENYPNAYNHLLEHKELLMQRKDSRKLYATGDQWYRHLRAGTFRYINPTKLIFKGVANSPAVGYLKANTAFNGANCPALIPTEQYEDSIDFLSAILNSKLIGYYLNQICPKKLGGYHRYNARNISQIPIVLPTSKIEIENSSVQIKSISNTIQTETDNFLKLLENRGIEKMSRNLQNWPSLDFKGFLKELKKAKVNLSLAEEAEWMDYFNAQKAKVQALQDEVDALDKQIDEMVYGLYGLSEEEIGIVEGV